MRLIHVRATSFRCFSEERPLDWRVGMGLNVLVGENDSGKSAVIDAIRLVLGTRSQDVRLVAEDFHVPAGSPRATQLRIRCSFAELSEDEQASFLEWCTFADNGAVSLDALLDGRLVQTTSGAQRVLVEWRSGPNGDGPAIQGAIREHLRATYLRPLRDAERELSPGRRSRLSQILSALPAMKAEDTNDFVPGAASAPGTIAGIVAQADHHIRENATVKAIERSITKDYLADLSIGGEDLDVSLSLGTTTRLEHVLERLELALAPPGGISELVRRGLGLNNVLFMAAELLLLQAQSDQLPLLLIEEPEAHLHPQLQARFIEIMRERAADAVSPIQIVLTTHSPLLASSVPLANMTMVASARTFSMGPSETHLAPDDYLFLERFLDATKANLFFAKGVIIVEGDAEQLLLPALADKLGRSLTKHGVSIVKVGHVGLFRYSRIFRRRSDTGAPFPVPVACIADRDIPPDAAKPWLSATRETEKEFSPDRLTKQLQGLRAHDGDGVRTFVSPKWTLEYDLALGGLARGLWVAMRLANSKAADTKAVKAKAEQEFDAITESGEGLALKLYAEMLDKRISKAITAQYLAQLVAELPERPEDFAARLPAYLVEAIYYVTGGPPVTAATA